MGDEKASKRANLSQIEDRAMANMDSWDWALLAVAGYVAVLSLVRLMSNHRDKVLSQFREQINQERMRKPRKRRKQKSTELHEPSKSEAA